LGLRNGTSYLESLRDGRTIIYKGQHIKDVTSAPGFAQQARAVAQFYDFQNLPQLRELMTYETPEGDRAGMSFLEPRTQEDLRRRAAAYAAWAEVSCGLLGRSPDYLNTMLTHYAGISRALEGIAPKVGQRLKELYLHVRRKDLHATHTFIQPFANRGQDGAKNTGVMRIIRETAEGLVVSGARGLATGAPFADLDFNLELPRSFQPGAGTYSLTFSVPINARGLSWLCRDIDDRQASTFDSPLSARADEVDCVAIFDEVTLRWDDIIVHIQDLELLQKLVRTIEP
jgi:aromatic ring hydroxylase